ncbi:MAG: tetratricopeptide repeat protein, partial [Myxococcales bacterium]|nr:tetratricopeptide repeat protein [Myxococcales bacterium]
AAQRWDEARRARACEDAGAVIDGAWNDSTRARVREALVATGAPYAPRTAAMVAPRLDEAAAAWTEARTEACMNADVRGRWSGALAARSRACLEEQRLEFTALVAEFGRADEATIHKAVQAVAGLKPAAACLDEDWLRRQPDPPEARPRRVDEDRLALALAWSIGLAGDTREALEVAEKARMGAEARARPTLIAAGRALEGRYLEQLGRFEEAEAASSDAYFIAANAGAWAIAADAATKLTHIVGGRRSRYIDGRAWARHAALAISYAGDWSGLAEAYRLSNLGLVEADAGNFAEARILLERSLELRERALGADHPEVASSLGNLGVVLDGLGEYEEARALHARVLELREATVGADHPLVATSLTNLAVALEAMGAYAEAKPLHERALAILEGAYGSESLPGARTLNNLGNVAIMMGDNAAAEARYRQALAMQEKLLGPDHIELAAGLNNLTVVLSDAGELAEARALQERALAIRRRALGPSHPDVALSLMMIANIDDETGDAAAAGERYREALAILEEQLGPEHPDVALCLVNYATLFTGLKRYAEAVAPLERATRILDALEGVQVAEVEAHWILAQALLGSGGDRARAVEEARGALKVLAEGDAGREDTVAEIKAWLAENDVGAVEAPPGP